MIIHLAWWLDYAVKPLFCFVILVFGLGLWAVACTGSGLGTAAIATLLYLAFAFMVIGTATGFIQVSL